jgi:LysM repeat protein
LITTTIKRCAWVMAAMVALSAALAVLLPGGIAEAQSPDDAATGSTLPGSDTQVHQADAAAMPQQQQPAYEPATLRVVNPGDTLWAISQQRFQPNPTAEQIMNEVGRIYELNRDLIGDDPNLIFPGQELLLPEVYKPAAITPAVSEPVAAVPEEQVPESSAATSNQLPETVVQQQGVPEEEAQRQATPEEVAQQQGVPEEEAAQEEQEVLEPINSELAAPSEQPASEEEAAAPTEEDEQVRRVPPWPQSSSSESPEDPYQADYYASNRRLLGLAIIVLTVLAALLMAWRLPMKRAVDSLPTAMWGSPLAAIRRRSSSPAGGRTPLAAIRRRSSSPAGGRTPLAAIRRRSSSPAGGRSTANESQPASGKEPTAEKAAASRRRIRAAPPRRPLSGDGQRRAQ